MRYLASLPHQPLRHERFPLPERGVLRNIMTGIVVCNVVRFAWVRAQAQDQTGAMLFIGSIRD